jgi:hypothetical protein
MTSPDLAMVWRRSTGGYLARTFLGVAFLLEDAS